MTLGLPTSSLSFSGLTAAEMPAIPLKIVIVGKRTSPCSRSLRTEIVDLRIETPKVHDNVLCVCHLSVER